MRWRNDCLVLALFSVSLFPSGLSAQSVTEPFYEGKSLTEWVEQLDSPKESVRLQAIQALSSLVTRTRFAIPALERALKDEKVSARRAGANARATVGSAAVPTLTRALWDEDRTTRLIAVLALGQIGPPARSAVPSLLERLKDGDLILRRRVLDTLADIDVTEVIPDLKPLLQDRDAEVRRKVCRALASLGAKAELFLPSLLQMLQKDDTVGRRFAVRMLGQLGPEAKPALPALVRALQDKDHQVRQGAARALGQMHTNDKGALEALQFVLQKDKHAGVQFQAGESLWRIRKDPGVVTFLKNWLKDRTGPRAIEGARLLWRIDKSPLALRVLGEILEEKRKGDLYAAARALSEIGPPAKAELPAIVALLKHEKVSVRHVALLALGRMGEAAKTSVAQIQSLLETRDTWLRLGAYLALWEIGKDPKALQEIVQSLKNRDVEVRQVVTGWLALQGPEVKEALPGLLAMLTDSSGRVRVLAAEAIWRIDQHRRALPVLVQALRDPDRQARSDAALVLGAELGDKAKPAVPALVQALWDEAPAVRSNAAEALGRIGPAAREAIPALIVTLKSRGQESPIYSSAAEALGQMGSVARRAVPVLLDELNHPDSYVRINAARALWHISRNLAVAEEARRGLESRRLRVRIVAAETLWFINRHPQAIPTLLNALQERDRNYANERYMAVRALGRIGPPARGAIPALRDLRTEENSHLREIAVWALSQIEAKAPSSR